MVAAAKTSTAVTAACFNWRYAPAYQAAWRTLRASRRGRCDTAGCASTGVVLPSSGLFRLPDRRFVDLGAAVGVSGVPRVGESGQGAC
jgi:hypothetical protein